MSSAAERFEAARLRHLESKTILSQFRAGKEFELDHFQVDACKALESGHGVLVAAPTGAGKTVVGEFAIHLARYQGGKAFYTTPIKALSNQKYHELLDVYGESEVGLLTGDVSINADAPIVVMTTEVLRNMLYVNSAALLGLRHVVMDEVHYLADRNRGAVWEEVILHLPESVSITALSATVSNVEEFGDWLRTVRGDTTVVVEEHRPVPLWQLVAADQKLIDLFVDEEQRKLNPELVRLSRQEQHQQQNRQRGRGRRGSSSKHTPFRDRLIRLLEGQQLLPAIWFLFSRAGCDQAVEQLMSQNLRLTSPAERKLITAEVAMRTADLADEDLVALDFAAWRHAIEAGVAAHHAGLLPRFKEIVESLFQQGLIKVVFATETLALGINMPAKTVVIERLSKWNGDTHVPLTPGEYTQLTGRAGRRGIDEEGNAVVLWQADLEPPALAGLASTRTYPLRSSFRPGFAMAVNTVASMGYDRALDLLGRSFAQFQADRGVAGLATLLAKQEEGLRGYAEAMQCHLGDFREYAELRAEITRLEKEASKQGRAWLREQTETGLAELQVGDVVMVTSGRRAGPAVVVEVKPDFGSGARVSVLGLNREVRRVGIQDFTGEVLPVERLKLPRDFDVRSARSRNYVAEQLRQRAFAHAPRKQSRPRNAVVEEQIAELRAAMRAHPCHGCNDREEHARWAERWSKLVTERAATESQISQRTNVLSRDFRRVCEVLAHFGYLSSAAADATVTERGNLLRRIHTESDLLVAEAVTRGLFDELAPVDLVTVLSTLVYEPRREEPESAPLPRSSSTAVQELQNLWQEISQRERQSKLQPTTKPELGFAFPIFRWASGAPLLQVMRAADMSAGDFVRTTRRLVDLLEQLRGSVAGEFAQRIELALALVRRGIVDEREWAD